MSEDRPPSAPPGTAATRTAEAVARTGLQTGSGPAPLARHIRRGLLGVVSSVIFIPLIFYLRFGIVGPLGWGLTVFLSAVSLLVEVGLYFRARPEYHTPVARGRHCETCGRGLSTYRQGGPPRRADLPKHCICHIPGRCWSNLNAASGFRTCHSSSGVVECAY